MKTIRNCPYCGSSLDNYQATESWFQQSCARRCDMDYMQFFDKSFDDENIIYNRFCTDHFLIYVYYDHPQLPYISHIYSRAVLKEVGTAFPIIKLPSNKINIFNLEELDKKLQTLSLFV